MVSIEPANSLNKRGNHRIVPSAINRTLPESSVRIPPAGRRCSLNNRCAACSTATCCSLCSCRWHRGACATSAPDNFQGKDARDSLPRLPCHKVRSSWFLLFLAQALPQGLDVFWREATRGRGLSILIHLPASPRNNRGEAER